MKQARFIPRGLPEGDPESGIRLVQQPLFPPTAKQLADERTDALIRDRRAEAFAREATRPERLEETRTRRQRLRDDLAAALNPGTPAAASTSPSSNTEPPPALTPAPSGRDESARSRRKRDVRASTVSIKRMTKRDLELGRMLYPVDEELPQRPTTRAACADVPRPCPFVSCKHHLYLDVSARTGAIKLNFPDLEVDELPADSSCAIDVADRGGVTLENVGEIMNLTRERIRQIEVKAFARLHASKDAALLEELHGDIGPVGKRRLPILPPRKEPEDEDEASGEDAADAEADFDAERFAGVELDAE